MIASVYIRDGNIHFYNENGSFSNLGGIEYALGRPLLDFICYEPEQFIGSFSMIASAFDNDYAHIGAKSPDFIAGIREVMCETQQREIYVYFYSQILMDFIYTFIESPQHAIMQIAEKIPGAEEKLDWALGFEWSASSSAFIAVQSADKERRLFRAVNDVVAVMYEHLCNFQKFIVHEIEVLLHYRQEIEVPLGRSIDFIDILDEYHDINGYDSIYLEKPFRTFYGRTATQEVEQLYVIDSIEDLFRFEFIKMIENDIFIKRCKNCERFFIPNRRQDTEYCDRLFADTNRKCSEVGAMLRYEKKVAENPVWEAYKKAYRRFNSRTRNKKMTQNEFLQWSEQASQKRDMCLSGELAFDDYEAWLEQGRVRKPRIKKQQDTE